MHASGKPLTRQIDLNLLELFDTVYWLRNLTAAGQQLGLSQSAVSYGLAKLHEMYGDALFVRMQRGVQPTSFADRLSEPVIAALDMCRSGSRISYRISCRALAFGVGPQGGSGAR